MKPHLTNAAMQVLAGKMPADDKRVDELEEWFILWRKGYELVNSSASGGILTTEQVVFKDIVSDEYWAFEYTHHSTFRLFNVVRDVHQVKAVETISYVPIDQEVE